MARPRIELQRILEEVLGSGNVYFQPKMGLQMKYPCIRYVRSKIENDSADNIAYRTKKKYELTAIYKDPDSDLPDKLNMLPCCKHDKYYVADNLHHDTFIIDF